jgi:hypothetical protein
MFKEENNFKYLGYEISYGNEKDVQQLPAKFAQKLGNLKKHFSTKFGPEVIKNKSIQCTGSPFSFIRKRNLGP